MPADIELGVTFDTDQAVNDLENEIGDVEVGATAAGTGGGGATGGGTGGELAAGLGVEAGSDIASGGGKGGILGSLAGGITKTVAILGAIVGFLALLEPVQKAVGFLVRQFELLVVPVLAALKPLLEILQKGIVQILNFFRNPDEFFTAIKNALAPFANTIINGLNTIPGVDIDPVQTEEQERVGFRSTGESEGVSTLENLAREQQFSPQNLILSGIETAGNFLLSDDARAERSQNQNSSDLAGNILG